MKKCSTCKIIKSLDNYNKCKSNKDGLHYVCKDCRKKEKLKVICYQRINESLFWLRKKLRYGENAMNDKLKSFEMGNQQPSS